jgi:hypothetical protein
MHRRPFYTPRPAAPKRKKPVTESAREHLDNLKRLKASGVITRLWCGDQCDLCLIAASLE